MNEQLPNTDALRVNEGIPPPPVVNEQAVQHFRVRKRQIYTANEYVEGILQHDRVMLSRAITLVESSLSAHASLARQIVELCLPHSGNSIRVGITGVPGVGKSTFIESLGKYLTQIGKRVAVLAVDPSSERSGGSILGDKTRMEQLAADTNAYIRPSPSSGTLGGVARATRESIVLCEAAGFDVVLVETVGVGQSETVVHSMVDFFLLLMLAGAGDELQGIKRGIMEMADALVITKADGDNTIHAQRARAQYAAAMHLLPALDSGWTPAVLTCSAIERQGIEQVWQTIEQYHRHTLLNGYLHHCRNEQSQRWFWQTFNEGLQQILQQNTSLQQILKHAEQQVLKGIISPFGAANDILQKMSNHIKLENL